MCRQEGVTRTLFLCGMPIGKDKRYAEVDQDTGKSSLISDRVSEKMVVICALVGV